MRRYFEADQFVYTMIIVRVLEIRAHKNVSRRDARVDESDGLENRCSLWLPWVRIPLPPLRVYRFFVLVGPC